MIAFYVGTPGSGKTYESILIIIDALKRKRVVYHNIDGLGDPGTEVVIAGKTGLLPSELPDYLKKMTPALVKNMFDWAPDGCLIVVDETQKYFNAKDYRNEENRKLSDWGDEHRHRGIDVLFLTPKIGKVESGVRALAQWTYVFRKMDMMGKVGNGRYRCRIYPDEETSGQHQSQFIKKYDTTIFGCYKSYFQDGTKENTFVKGANLFSHPIFFVIPVAVVIAGYFIFKSPLAHGDILGAKELAAKNNKSGIVSGSETVKTSPSPPGAQAPPPHTPGSAGKGEGGNSVEEVPIMVVIGYINGVPIYRHTASGRVIVPPGVPRVAPNGASADYAGA